MVGATVTSQRLASTGNSSVRDMTIRTGLWPRSIRVVSRGLSRLTVCPPTIIALDRARVLNTVYRDSFPDTHAECPDFVAILPSKVIAYFRMEKGRRVTARCSRASLARLQDYSVYCTWSSPAKTCADDVFSTSTESPALRSCLVADPRRCGRGCYKPKTTRDTPD